MFCLFDICISFEKLCMANANLLAADLLAAFLLSLFFFFLEIKEHTRKSKYAK